MKKLLLKIKLWPSLVLFFLFAVYLPRPAYAQCVTNTFNFRVTDQNGNPLQGAFVPVYWKGKLFTYCSTDSSGQCYVCLSCATPCELSGDVEYQGYKGNYSGTYPDGALIEVVINIPAPVPSPSPTPSPYPSPGPSPTPGPYPSLTCNPSLPGDRDSRPYYNYNCDLCNLTNLKTLSCAESFTVHDNVSFYWWEGQKCSVVTPEEYWVETPWGGIVTINPSETTIPFVGKKGNEEEKLYLADYFEGTNEYYQNYGKYWLDWVNHAGVLRKLTPMEYQDKLKENMIENRIASPGPPQEGKVHDYKLKYIGRVCWDIPFLADALLAFAERLNLPVVGQPIEAIAKRGHYCLFEGSLLDNFSVEVVENAIRAFNLVSPIDIALRRTGSADTTLSSLAGHYPPDPSEENYLEKWNAWKESEWGRLWEVVPLVSREDTPGDINPYLGSRPRDTFIVNNPEAQIEKVPHVARLYEASQEVQKIMTPLWQTGGTAQKETGTIIASAGEKVLLAQAATGGIPCGCKVYYPSPDCSCMNRIKSDGEPECNAEQNLVGWCGYHLGRYGGCICGYANCQGPPNCQCSNLPFCPDAGGAPPAPACGLAEARPVSSCQLAAITDSNPNDDLCCDPININLTAVDSFNITGWYKECEERQNEIPPRPCGPKTEDVSRQIGINLSHPYLYEIWNQTGESETAGIFNFFRPASVPKFSDIDAASQISYQYKGNPADPPVGKFYFPYLGGVQLAKQWLIQTLTPWK